MSRESMDVACLFFLANNNTIKLFLLIYLFLFIYCIFSRVALNTDLPNISPVSLTRYMKKQLFFARLTYLLYVFYLF